MATRSFNVTALDGLKSKSAKSRASNGKKPDESGTKRENGMKGSPTYAFIALEDHNSPALVSCGQEVSGLVELDARNDISCKRRPETQFPMIDSLR